MHYKSFTNRINHAVKVLREEGPGLSVTTQYRRKLDETVHRGLVRCFFCISDEFKYRFRC